MPKLRAPFMSAEARGTWAGALTVKRSRGQNVATIIPIPTQRYTLAQAEAKAVVQATGAISFRVSRNQVGMADGATMTPLEFLQALIRPPLTWANVFTRIQFPQGRATMATELAAWDGLDAGEITAWETWNTALANSFEDILPQQGGTRTIDGATVAFIFARGMARAGYLTTIPLGTPPVWDNSIIQINKAKHFKGGMFPPAKGKPAAPQMALPVVDAKGGNKKQ